MTEFERIEVMLQVQQQTLLQLVQLTERMAESMLRLVERMPQEQPLQVRGIEIHDRQS